MAEDDDAFKADWDGEPSPVEDVVASPAALAEPPLVQGAALADPEHSGGVLPARDGMQADPEGCVRAAPEGGGVPGDGGGVPDTARAAPAGGPAPPAGGGVPDDGGGAPDDSGAESGDAKEPLHNKFNVAVANFGGLRNKGDELYCQNVWNLPCFLCFVMEATPKHVEQWTKKMQDWRPASSSEPMQQPLQGFAQSCAGGSEQTVKWLSSELYEQCVLVGRASRVRDFTTVDKWCIEGPSGGISRLLMVDVVWRQPVNGKDSIRVICGHLHNVTARRNGPSRIAFFAKLAEFCAGGARLLALDANMAMFRVVPSLKEAGIGTHLVAHHMELSNPAKGSQEPLFDTLGVWVIGPMDHDRTEVLTPKTHACAGARHPFLMDVPLKNYNRGYGVKQHDWLLEAETLQSVSDATAFVDAELGKFERMTAGSALADSLGMRPWTDVWLANDWMASGGAESHLGMRCKLPLREPYTYDRQDGHGRQQLCRVTDDWEPMPRCQEILADGRLWDPFGHRWGRDSHWPLLVSVNTQRFRSKQMQQKRKAKERERQRTMAAKACAGGLGKGKGKAKLGGDRVGGKSSQDDKGGAGKGKQKGAASTRPPPVLRPAHEVLLPPSESQAFKLLGDYKETATWCGHTLFNQDGEYATWHHGVLCRLRGPNPRVYAWHDSYHYWEKL